MWHMSENFASCILNKANSLEAVIENWVKMQHVCLSFDGYYDKMMIKSPLPQLNLPLIDYAPNGDASMTFRPVEKSRRLCQRLHCAINPKLLYSNGM